MKNPKILWIGIITLISLIGIIYYSIFRTNNAVITSFAECVTAGYPILESYPEQCNTPDGKHFVNNKLGRPSEVLPPSGPDAIACTTEAKECPDGSYVGRTGPNCEFSVCPE